MHGCIESVFSFSKQIKEEAALKAMGTDIGKGRMVALTTIRRLG